MKIFYPTLLVIAVVVFACNKGVDKDSSLSTYSVESYLTSLNQSYKLAMTEPGIVPYTDKSKSIVVNTSEVYQTMDGFGFSLTGGSAQHLLSLPQNQRQALLEELFGSSENSISISYLRISLGSSDLDEKAFSYNDIDPNKKDIGLEEFSLKEDENDLIPILKEILAINPDIKIMASPWSPPAWMKTNKSTKGGSLLSEYYNIYANYFTRYIKSMAEHGITIDAITVQNEPLHPGNNPSLYMTPEEQATFIKQSLGPVFEKEGIDSKIIIYDHNADRIDYPMTVLNDPEANKYIDGSAFHLYGGVIDNLEKLYEAHPDKNIYFTEQWIGAPGDFEHDFPWHMKNLIIGASRNHCKTVLEWNLTSAPDLQPHTNGGCTECLGAITIDNNEIIRNPAYYIIGHASKFVPPGSIRIFSSELDSIPNVAFLTPEDDIVLIVLNETDLAKSVNINLDGNQFALEIEPLAGITYVFDRQPKLISDL